MIYRASSNIWTSCYEKLQSRESWTSTFLRMSRLCLVTQDSMISVLPIDVPFVYGRLYQRCTISIFHYWFHIDYSVSLFINIHINFNYFNEGLSVSILYQFGKNFPYRFQYQSILSMSPMVLIRFPISYQLVTVINID